MELRVDEAQAALPAYAAGCACFGDAEAVVMALSRHAMLAMLRGRFDVGSELVAEFSARARQIGLPDAERLDVGCSCSGPDPSCGVAGANGKSGASESAWSLVGSPAICTKQPRHGYSSRSRPAEAAAVLDRLLPHALAASGPRWLGAITDLSAVAAEVGNQAAASQLYESSDCPMPNALWCGAARIP